MNVLIAITSCARFRDRREAIRDTWLSQVPDDVDARFVLGKGNMNAPDYGCGDVMVLDCPDSYQELPQKTFQLVQHAHSARYDLLIKVDDDTFLLPRADFIAEFAKHDCLASVRRIPTANDGIPYPQGGCYSLNRRAMEAVLKRPELFTVGLEDGAVGRALQAEGVTLTHTDRIKTTQLYGAPTNSTSGAHGLRSLIMAAHCCPPRTMRQLWQRGRVG